ncbi:MAG TPA: hypothetical protein VI670_11810 [Thermoanaerobaculia bacterium]|jgi:hypothetical protein
MKKVYGEVDVRQVNIRQNGGSNGAAIASNGNTTHGVIAAMSIC